MATVAIRTVNGRYTCDAKGCTDAVDQDAADLSMIRFRYTLCGWHYNELRTEHHVELPPRDNEPATVNVLIR